MGSVGDSTRIALTVATIAPLLADCATINNGLVGDPEKLSEFTLEAVTVKPTSRSPAVVSTDIKECEAIARTESPIGVDAAGIVGRSAATGMVTGAATGAVNRAGTNHAGLGIGLDAVGGALNSTNASIHTAQNIAAMQAYNQTLAKPECLLERNYADAVVAPPDVLSRAKGAMSLRNTPATEKFDGTYAFISSTQLYATFKHGTGQCGSVTASELTIVDGKVRFFAGNGGVNGVAEGAVDARGQLTTISSNPFSGTTITGYGQVNGDGSISLRSTGWFCDQDFVWKK